MKVHSRISGSTYHPVGLRTGLVAAVFVFFAASLVTAHDQFTEKMASLKRAVVIVTTYDAHGRPSLQGSGFFIASDRIVTNLHVVNHASEIRIKTFAGNTFTVHTVIAADGNSDLVLLKMDAPCPDAITLQVNGSPTEGESIILLSNPQGSHWKVTRGRVGRIWQFEKIGSRMQITAGVFPGSSGGPVLNQQGQVIGIAVMRIGSADELNFAVPAESLIILQATASLAGDRAMASHQPAQPQ
ncbi:MAG TPA: serine protease [Pyrinomonadaceae bacterium]